MKIKSKIIRSTIQDKDILETFQELLGTSDTNACLPIAHPKYIKLQSHVHRFLKLLNMLKDSNVIKYFPDIQSAIAEYTISLEKDYEESFSAPDLTKYCDSKNVTLVGLNYSTVPKDIKTEFSIKFNNIKKCNIVNIIIVTCKNLIPYKKYIESKDSLSDLFLTKSAGNIVAPIAELPSVNFKRIYNDNVLSNNDKSFILVTISKMFEISHDVYEALSSPDIDVNEFVAVILNSIDVVKKHIPRCDDAFNKIVESVDILKNNFGDYYKDFMASSNPSIIMENFVLDVSKHSKATPKLTNQFRKIISYYRSIASKGVTDPRLQSLFKHVDKNFEALDKCNKNKTNEEDDEEEDDEDVEIINDVAINEDNNAVSSDVNDIDAINNHEDCVSNKE